LVGDIISQICDALARGEQVTIRGFGSFVLLEKGERTGRNPRSGVAHRIAPHRALAFHPSLTLRGKIIGRDLRRSRSNPVNRPSKGSTAQQQQQHA